MDTSDRASVGRLVLRAACYFVALLLLTCASWVSRNFGSPTIPQIIYHLQFAETLATADTALLISFVAECVVLAIVLTIVVVAFDRFFAAFFEPARAAVASRYASIGGRLQRALPGVALGVSLIALGSQFSVLTYASVVFTGADPLGDSYVDPRTVTISAKDPKNLILIYVESLEGAYADANTFGQNLLEPLESLPGVSFRSHRPSRGVEWTMAGLVGTQCGIPLQFVTRVDGTSKSVSIAANDSGARVRAFLPNVVCLSDILHSFGYRNVFVGGADLGFAGKGNYLTTHRYDEVYGLSEWKAMGVRAPQFSGWGLYDDDLFAFAKKKIAELHEADSRFNLTLLTVDTHHPKGHYSKTCRQRGAKGFTDIVRCTSEQVVEFVDSLREAGYLENTNVVVLGDHLAMPNPVHDLLERHSDRTLFNKFLSETPPPKNSEDVDSFDMFPSILEFTGFSVANNRLGLGRSAFFEADALQASAPRPDVPLETLSYSETYRRFWVEEQELRVSRE